MAQLKIPQATIQLAMKSIGRHVNSKINACRAQVLAGEKDEFADEQDDEDSPSNMVHAQLLLDSDSERTVFDMMENESEA